jgi:hypothetical protein
MVWTMMQMPKRTRTGCVECRRKKAKVQSVDSVWRRTQTLNNEDSVTRRNQRVLAVPSSPTYVSTN